MGRTAMYCEANYIDSNTDYLYLNILGGLEFSLQIAGNQSGHAWYNLQRHTWFSHCFNVDT